MGGRSGLDAGGATFDFGPGFFRLWNLSRVVVSILKNNFCSYLPQEMIPFKEQIFQMGWFNQGTSVNTLLSGHAAMHQFCIPTALLYKAHSMQKVTRF